MATLIQKSRSDAMPDGNQITAKACTACGLLKPLDGYYAHKAGRGGRMSKCMECVKTYMRQHREENIGRIRAYDRRRGRLSHRLEANRERSRLPQNRDRNNQLKREWQARNAQKRACHVITGNAIRDGRLVKEPCEVCGDAAVDAHHDDYTKPLQVRWLCRSHHMETHRRYK